MLEPLKDVKTWAKGIVPAGVGLFVVDFALNGFDVLLTLGDVLFVPLSVFFGSVAGNVGWISRATLEPFIVWLGMLYAANILLKNVSRFGDDDD